MVHRALSHRSLTFSFLIEGLPGIVLAVTTFLALPSCLDKSNYITEEERALVHARLNKDSLGKGHTGIDWRGVRRALTDWKTYVVSLTHSAMNLTLGSISGFLPTIVKGYCNSFDCTGPLTLTDHFPATSPGLLCGRCTAIHCSTLCRRFGHHVPHLVHV